MVASISRCILKGFIQKLQSQGHRYIKLKKSLISPVVKNASFSTNHKKPLLRFYSRSSFPLSAVSSTTVRFNSTTTESVTDTSYIPPLPGADPTLTTDQVVETLNALGEPTLQSLGLGSYYPNGLVQQALEFLHVSCGLPWWGSIVAGTIVLRLCVFPVMIKVRKEIAHFNKHMPHMQKLQKQSIAASKAGNHAEAMKFIHETRKYAAENDVAPWKQLRLALVQAPIFISVFTGLRQMCNLPVESMKEGGALFFTDLTITQPFYTLPLMTAVTILLTLELGSDGIRIKELPPSTRVLLRLVPFVSLPFFVNFPSAMLVYWFTQNVFSLCQVMFLKIPAVMKFFDLPKPNPVDYFDLNSKLKSRKGFLEEFSESYNAMKAQQMEEEKKRLEEKKRKQEEEDPFLRNYQYKEKKSKENVNKKTKENIDKKT